MVCRAARRLKQHLGRRGAFLLILGVGKICWGVGFIAATPASSSGLDVLTRLCSLSHWGWLWVAAGAIMICSSLVRIGRDRFGFIVALVPPTVWALAYAVAAIRGDYPRGAWVAVWYLTSHVGVILWAASVPEHSVPRHRRGRRGTAP
ncbi:hypothetical protein ACFYMO_04030 [Streptomyces sp. NPDC007025]|uniref:hypothetical protein n=1 Tax=Streptomyces sp. NPDC007025 TaxID=3364771 RepID=UPI0036981E53